MAELTNRVVHFEIHASDCKRASEFYKNVFSWNIQKWEGGEFEYYLVMAGEGKVVGAIHGGLLPRKGEAPTLGQPVNAFICTIEVDNVDETVEKVKASGGSIALPAQDYPGVGKLAYGIDTEGNIFGFIKSVVSVK